MGDNSIFSVFSNIWLSVRLKIPPPIPSFLVTKIVYIGYGQIQKITLFLLPFHSCAPCIFISYCCLCQSGSMLLLYAGSHKISLKYLFPEKMFIEICCQKCQKCNTICVTTFFYWKGFVKKKKNIYTPES